MSHAANLRNRHRPDDPQVHSLKRRRTSTDQFPLPSKVNGIRPNVNGAYSSPKYTASTTPIAKTASTAQPVESDAKIRLPDDEKDVEMEIGGDGVGEMSSSGESDSLSGGQEDSDEDRDHEEDSPKPQTNGHSANGTHEEHADLDTQEEQAHKAEEDLSFGDILRSRGQESIDVQDLYTADNPTPSALAPTTYNQTLSIPTATSLGTVLTQALRTNDVDLLESCFQVPNLDSIRATIERLHSSHATNLLQKLAERLHKRPGRAGSLMVWIQWTVVAHGGYLASQPAAMRELHTLYQVVRQRATGLQPLLALKGKLDMLEAQLQLRRNMQTRAGAGLRKEVTTYVEGQDEDSSGDEAPAVDPSGHISQSVLKRRGTESEREVTHSLRVEPSAADSDEEDDMPTTLPNGEVMDDLLSGEEADSDASLEDEDLIDDEAEETDDDSEIMSEDVDYDDVDGDSQVPDSEGEDPPPKRSKKVRHA